MANPGVSPDLLQAAVAAYHQHGDKAAAARALGLDRGTYRNRLSRALRLGVSPATFEMEAAADPVLDAETLLRRRSEQFARLKAAEESRKLIPVRLRDDRPFGVALFGDPHVDDNGTDIDLLRRHVQVVQQTEGLYAGNVGDYSNNWVGRLARLYGEQSTSAAEAWVLVEWLIRALPWMFLVAGNHDLWSGSGDPIKWMAKAAKAQYYANGMRLGLTTPKGRVIRINARHDFTGHSQWNTTHGPAKAAQMGWRDHVLICGHKHTSGYQMVKDPSSGLISHALRVGSYKTFDKYAAEKGLPNQTVSPCVMLVVQPSAADDSPKLITVFHDLEMGAEFLTWLRGRA